MTASPPGHCTACNADFDSGPIPEEIRHHYSPPYRWSRRIGVIWNDRVQVWMCPDCGHEEPAQRLPSGQHSVACQSFDMPDAPAHLFPRG